jgi:hypothetical protein
VVDGSYRDRFTRHSKYDAGGFVLRDSRGAVSPHFEQTLSPVTSHTRHDDAYRIRACRMGDRPKQDVNAGPVPAHQWTLDDICEILSTRPANQQMLITWRDQCLTAREGQTL